MADAVPNANALITVAEARGFFPGKEGTGEDPLLQELVNAASDYIVNSVCFWALKSKAYTNYRCAGPNQANDDYRKLYPPASPIDITKTISIAVDDVAQTVWKQESDGARRNFDVLVFTDEKVGYPNCFYRAVGWGSPSSQNPQPILLTYTGGFDPLPDNLKQAVKMVVQTFYRHRQIPQDVASFGGGGPMPPGVVLRPESYIPMQTLAILQGYKRDNL